MTATWPTRHIIGSTSMEERYPIHATLIQHISTVRQRAPTPQVTLTMLTKLLEPITA